MLTAPALVVLESRAPLVPAVPGGAAPGRLRRGSHAVHTERVRAHAECAAPKRHLSVLL